MADNWAQIAKLVVEAIKLWPNFDHYQRSLIRLHLRGEPWPQPPGMLTLPVELMSVIGALRELFPLIETDDVLGALPGAAVTFDVVVSPPILVGDVAFTLYLRSLWTPNYDASKIVADMRQFATTDSATVPVILLIGGPRITGTHDLGNGVELLSLQDLTARYARYANTIAPVRLYIDRQQPAAALVRSVRIRCTTKAPSASTDRVESSIVYRDLFEQWVAITAITDCLAYPIATLAKTPESSPVIVSGMPPSFEWLSFAPREVGTPGIAMWRENLAGLFSLPKQSQIRVSRALYRLHQARLEWIRGNEVDACIDLRVALESCLAAERDGPGEITYRLSVRAARFLGTDSGKRDEIRGRVRDVYRWCSSVVHASSSRDAKKALEQGIPICRDVLAKILQAKDLPNWLDFDLSAT